jgi:hypothetical protein
MISFFALVAHKLDIVDSTLNWIIAFAPINLYLFLVCVCNYSLKKRTETLFAGIQIILYSFMGVLFTIQLDFKIINFSFFVLLFPLYISSLLLVFEEIYSFYKLPEIERKLIFKVNHFMLIIFQISVQFHFLMLLVVLFLFNSFCLFDI